MVIDVLNRNMTIFLFITQYISLYIVWKYFLELMCFVVAIVNGNGGGKCGLWYMYAHQPTKESKEGK